MGRGALIHFVWYSYEGEKFGHRDGYTEKIMQGDRENSTYKAKTI